MVRFVLTFCIAVIGFTAASAQQPIPNGDLESWTLYPGQGSFKSYEEPNDGWSSGNGAIHVAPNADPVCEKSTDAQSGIYSAKLTTRKIFGQIASGSMYLGTFKLNLGNPRESARLGVPYTDRPVQFKGYYKYLPSGGDSAMIRATLRKWNGATSDTIGEAKMLVPVMVESWTPFNLVFDYRSEEQPDTIEVVFAASAGGEFFRGDEGSTLYIDNVSVSNEPLTIRPVDRRTPLVNWTSAQSRADVHESLYGQRFQVVDLRAIPVMDGRADANGIDLTGLPHGFYVIVFDKTFLPLIR